MSDPTLPTEERRSTPRVESQLLVKFRVLSDPLGKWHMTPLKDLSSGGVRFTAEHPAAPGTALELQLLLPTMATPLRLTGRVSWARPSTMPHLVEYGVAFTELPPAQRADIDQLIALYRSRKHPAK